MTAKISTPLLEPVVEVGHERALCHLRPHPLFLVCPCAAISLSSDLDVTLPLFWLKKD